MLLMTVKLTQIVLASSIKLEYPITDAVPSIVHTRDRFLAKLYDFRKHAPGRDLATDEDFELLYAYGMFLSSH
jgi:hypothetical protein